jgi:hypothetical protein
VPPLLSQGRRGLGLPGLRAHRAGARRRCRRGQVRILRIGPIRSAASSPPASTRMCPAEDVISKLLAVRTNLPPWLTARRQQAGRQTGMQVSFSFYYSERRASSFRKVARARAPA